MPTLDGHTLPPDPAKAYNCESTVAAIIVLHIRGGGMKVDWVDGFEIRVGTHGNELSISANREGLISLARQLMALAEGAPGDHIHYDQHTSLEAGSHDMVIERLR